MPRLHLDRLECQTTVRDLRAALKCLPTSVDETYDDAMTRIQNQVPEYSKLAMSALSWISNALRPLYWDELQLALAIRLGDHNFDEEGLVDETLLISITAGLITLDAQSQIFRLAHFTIEEYFKRNKAWFPNAHSQIAEACMTYLSFDVFATGPCSSFRGLKLRLQKNGFLRYASQNWGHHTLRADENINEAVTLYLLTNDQMVSCCNQVRVNERYLHESYNTPHYLVSGRSSGLHLAAQQGLLSIFKKLLKHRPGADSKDYEGQTPLTLAAIEGQVEMVKFLVDRDDVAADSRDYSGRTPLSLAAFCRHTDIVKLLLTRDDVAADSRNSAGRTPLLYAAISGDTDIVKLLLTRDDIGLNSPDSDGRTPLLNAAFLGHTDIVKLLLTRDDIALNARDYTGHTPLLNVVSYGRTDIVKLLLARDDVSADSRDYDGCTPLSYAAEEGCTDIVKLLLFRDDVAVDSRDNAGRTPLLYAAKEGYHSVVKVLLDRGDVVVNSRDKFGHTPLYYAHNNRHRAVVQLLEDRLRSSKTKGPGELDQ